MNKLLCLLLQVKLDNGACFDISLYYSNSLSLGCAIYILNCTVTLAHTDF